MKTRLFFDIELSGHHSEYFRHIVEEITKRRLQDNFLFVVHPEFTSKFPDILAESSKAENIRFFEITQEEYVKAHQGCLLRRSLKEYKLMDSYVKKNNAQSVCLLYLNTFQLALGWYKANYKISGILFLQFYRMSQNSLKEKIKYFRKYWQTWFFVRNKMIKRVFVLNDSKTAEYLNKEFKTSIFQMLPDPVPSIIAKPEFNIRKVYGIEPNHIVLLHFGALSERKGTIDILESFSYLAENVINKIAVLFIGTSDSKTSEDINSRILAIKKTYPDAFVVFKNEFVPNEIMKAYFEQSDIILIPYKNTEASSGILGHAIASNKIVLGSRKGLLGELIADNNLGITIDEINPESIAEGIKMSIENFVPTYNREHYLTAHSKELFASAVIKL